MNNNFYKITAISIIISTSIMTNTANAGLISLDSSMVNNLYNHESKQLDTQINNLTNAIELFEDDDLGTIKQFTENFQVPSTINDYAIYPQVIWRDDQKSFNYIQGFSANMSLEYDQASTIVPLIDYQQVEFEMSAIRGIPATIPEPTSIAVILLSLMGLVIARFQRSL